MNNTTPPTIVNENPKKNAEQNTWNRSTFDSLLKQAFKKKFYQGNSLNIIGVNNVRYASLPSEIRDIMTNIRDENPEVYPGLTDEIIYAECPSAGKLKADFLNHILKPLQNRRNKLESHILSSTDILTVIPQVGQDQSIMRYIGQLTEDEIGEYLVHHKKLCRWIEKLYGKESGTIAYVYPKISELFSETERNSFPQSIQDILQDTIERQSHGDRLSRSSMRTLFRYFNDDHSALQRIANFFRVELTLKSLYDAGVLIDDKLENIAFSIFGNDWKNDLSVDERKKVLQQLKYDDETKIQLTNDFLSNLDISKIKTTLINGLNDRLSALAVSAEGGEDVGDDIIMGDLLPETKDTQEIWHNVWLDKLDLLFRKRSIQNPGLQKLHKNAIYRWTDTSKGEIFTIRILEEDFHNAENIEPGLRIGFLKSGKNGISRSSGEDQFFTYADFGKFILQTGANAHVYVDHEFDAMLSMDENEVKKSNGQKILDVGAPEIDTVDRLTEELNTYIDEAGKNIAFEPDMVFVSRSGEVGMDSVDVAYTIQSIESPYVTITNGRDIEKCTFDDFVAVARSQGCKRIAKISNDTDFVHALEKYGVAHAEVKDGKLATEIHEHDEHGHEKKVAGEYKFFESEQGGHIMVGAIEDGWVHFGEWSGTDMNLGEFRERQKKGKSLTEKEKKNLYSWKTVSYGIFLKYLGENKMTATTKNLHGDTNADYHGHPPHMESSLFKRWMRGYSVADIMHGLKGIGHAVEHYFEKGSKLNASRASLKMARMMGLSPDMIAQLQADEVGNMKEIIEKLVSKLESQNGPVGRKKALHIVHSKGSRPEEIVAAAMYMVKGYGQLYAEDLKHAQGTESFINAIIYACGYTSDAAIDEQKRKARDKFRADMGTEPGQPIQEEEMIWGFLKTMDGNASENPLAGALVKAMGGPSGWERMWRTEGHKGAIEKGKRQTDDIPNGQGRLNKFFSALGTHECNTAIGMMDSVVGKAKSPDMQGAPVVWCLTGMTNYVSTKLAQQELHQFVASKGYSFHAYSFLRNKARNDNYREVFLSALEGIADPSEIGNVKSAIAAVQYHGHDDPHTDRDAKKQVKNFEYINSIWRKYEGKGLHDRLQGRNSWLIEQVHIHHNKQATEYLETLSGQSHIMLSKDNTHSNDNGWTDEFGHNSSPIIKYTDDKLLSFEWHIAKLKKDGSTTYALNKDMFERFWPPIVQTMKNLKNVSNEDLQKKQYLQYRKDIVDHFRRILGSFGRGEATEEVLRSVRAQPYYYDLQNMGISIEEFFTEMYSTHDGIAEQDYLAWKNGTRNNTKSSRKVVDVEGTVQNIVSHMNTPAANDPEYTTEYRSAA